MEINLLLLLLNVAGALWAVGIWVGKNAWVQPLLQRVWRWIYGICPGYRTLRELKQELALAGDLVALIRLRQEALEVHTSAAVVVTDASGDLIWASYPFLDLVEMSFPEVRGDNWINCIHQDDRSNVMRTWQAAVKTNSTFSMDFRYWRRRSKTSQWVSTMAKPAFNPFSGTVSGWTATVKKLSRPPGWAVPSGGRADCPAGHWVPPLDRPDFGK